MSIAIVNLELRFHPEEQFFLCDKTYTTLQPVVYYVVDDNYAYLGKLYHSVTYRMYYSVNGAIGFGGIAPYNEALGYHDNDIECIRIIYDVMTKQPAFVFFSAHAQEGVWIEYNKCKFSGEYLIIYPSKFSHSNRPYAGTYLRMLGLANDKTSNFGLHVRPILVEDQSFKNQIVQNKEVFSGWWRPILIPILQSKVKTFKEAQAKREYKINKNVVMPQGSV